MIDKLTTSDPVLIAERLKQLRAGFVIQWTATIVLGGDNGYQVAIADKDVRGYTDTGITIPIHDYGKAYDVIDQVNEILFPDRTAKENMLIQLSTMSTGGKIAEFNQDSSTWETIPATDDQDGGDPGAVVLFDNIEPGNTISVEGVPGVFTVLAIAPDSIKVINREDLKDTHARRCWIPRLIIEYKGHAYRHGGIIEHDIRIPLWFLNKTLKFWKHAK